MEKKSSLQDSANGDDAASGDDDDGSFISGNSGFGTDKELEGEGNGEAVDNSK